MIKAIIGINGYKQTGKDEAYRAIYRTVGGVHRLAFADPLKQELAKACGVTTDYIEQHKDKFRLGMQWWGTEFRRELFSQEYWIDQARTSFYQLVREDDPYVVIFTDVRFPNEGKLIQEIGGKVWRVNRPKPSGGGWLANVLSSVAEPDDLHPSEIAMNKFPFDRVLYNDGTLQEYHEKVVAAFVEEFGPIGQQSLTYAKPA